MHHTVNSARTPAWVRSLTSAMSAPPRGLLIALWVVAGLALAVSLAVQYVNPVLPGEPWQSQGQLVDFRDSVWTPGRYLLSGGNPYDTATYLAAFPWTQGLALYAPAWLIVALPLAPLPFLVANAIYQLLGIATILTLIRVVLRMGVPRYVAVGTPIGLVWLTVWAAGRYALANVSTALVVLGVVLVLRGVWLRKTAVVPQSDLARAATAAGVAMCLLKPQFGVMMVVVALAGRRGDAVWRGVLGLTVLSAPIAIACVIASGGVNGFMAGISSNLARSTSSESAAGLFSPFNVSIDVVGQLARLGVDPPGWVRLAVPAVGLCVAVWLVVRSRALIVLSAGVTSLMLLTFIHQFYDLLVLVLPLCVGIGWLAERRTVPRLHRALWAFVSVPTVHVHRVSTNVVPGLTTTGADRVDTLVLLTALLLSLVATVRGDRREPGSGERGGPVVEPGRSSGGAGDDPVAR